MPRGRPPKNRQPIERGTHTPIVCTRDPIVENRDPVIQQPKQTEKRPYHSRLYIPASMPTICPKCGHNTRCGSGRHIDPVRKTIVEYRTCVKCGQLLGAGRPMTEREKELLCQGADVVKDYEETIKQS